MGNMVIRSWSSLFLVILCFSTTVLLLGCIRPNEEMLLGYDLDKVKLLRYNCTSRSPGANLPTYTWELTLEVEKVGKGRYALIRTLTNIAAEGLELYDIPPEVLGPIEPMLVTLGGLNGTFELDQQGNISKYLYDEYTFGQENSITGGWVTATTSNMITGRGYLQELPPLPSETMLIGDFWNGTFTYNTTVQIKGGINDISTIGDNSGYVVCEAVRRDKRETPAGEFSVLEIDTLWQVTNYPSILYLNGTIKKFTGMTSSYEGEVVIDIATGVVVYSVKTFEALEEEVLPSNEVVLELVKIEKS